MPHRLMHRAMGAYTVAVGVGSNLCIVGHWALVMAFCSVLFVYVFWFLSSRGNCCPALHWFYTFL
ncbi:hypothetical protein K440DRAFT_613427 [Wilcoxina mikolae CBS 423.85]|nr:hypothetical protein K440DRAFT_613427 [Wilcoxina mikolae CBS 423.85]